MTYREILLKALLKRGEKLDDIIGGTVPRHKLDRDIVFPSYPLNCNLEKFWTESFVYSLDTLETGTPYTSSVPARPSYEQKRGWPKEPASTHKVFMWDAFTDSYKGVRDSGPGFYLTTTSGGLYGRIQPSSMNSKNYDVYAVRPESSTMTRIRCNLPEKLAKISLVDYLRSIYSNDESVIGGLDFGIIP